VDQREAEVAIAEHAHHLAREQLGFDSFRPLEPPGRANGTAREQALQRTVRREVGRQRRLECGEGLCALAVDQDVLLRTQPVLERVARLALRAFRPA
jgi:hypothetical protein